MKIFRQISFTHKDLISIDQKLRDKFAYIQVQTDRPDPLFYRGKLIDPVQDVTKTVVIVSRIVKKNCILQQSTVSKDFFDKNAVFVLKIYRTSE